VVAPDFFALLDITKVSTYIMYLDLCKKGPNLVRFLMTHLKFKNSLFEALLVGWKKRTEIRNETLTHRPNIHMPFYSHKEEVVYCL
jgi:hypothetical protein